MQLFITTNIFIDTHIQHQTITDIIFFNNYVLQYREHLLMKNISKKRKRALDSLPAGKQGNHWQFLWEVRGIMERNNEESRVILSYKLFPWKTMGK